MDAREQQMKTPRREPVPLAKMKAPKRGQIDYPAERFSGLRVRVFASGRMQWHIRGRVKVPEGQKSGPPLYVALGDVAKGEVALPGALTLAQAVAAALMAREALRLGRDPVLEREAQSVATKTREMTFGGLVEEYLTQGTRKIRANTRAGRTAALRGKWFADWRSRPLSWVTPGRVAALAESMPDTAASTPLGSLRAALKYAELQEYIDRAPSVTVPRVEGDAAPLFRYQEGGTPDFAELAVVLDAIDELQEKFPLSPWPTIWRLNALTGARPMTVCGARWEEFNLSSAPVWHLPAERSKLKRAISIPLSDAAAAILRGLPRKESGLLWPRRDGKKPIEDYPPEQLGVVRGLLAARGYKAEFWPGRFRDTFMSWVDVQEDASERAIALLVDHRAPSERTTRGRHYTRYQSDVLARKLANRWAATVAQVRQDAAQLGDVVVPHPAPLRAVAAA